jgi:hypothetical protein
MCSFWPAPHEAPDHFVALDNNRKYNAFAPVKPELVDPLAPKRCAAKSKKASTSTMSSSASPSRLPSLELRSLEPPSLCRS